MVTRTLLAGLLSATATSGAVLGSASAAAGGTFAPATDARVRVFQQYTDAAMPAGLQAPATADVFNGIRADLDRLATE